MIRIGAMRFYDLLPPNLRDREAAALSAALDPPFFAMVDALPKMLVMAGIGNLDHDMLDHLAVTFKVDGYEGSFDLATKRSLMERVVANNARKGTASAVRSVVSAIYGDAVIVEWFEEEGPPFTFRIELDGTEIAIGEADYDNLRRVIYAYKSVRSTMGEITLLVKGRGKNPNVFRLPHLELELAIPNFADCVTLDGRYLLDGSWPLNQTRRGTLSLDSLDVETSAVNREALKGTLVRDNLFCLDGSWTLDGSKNLDAYYTEEEI